MTTEKFTWVKTHKALVEIISKKRNQQEKLVDVLRKVGIAGLHDEDKNGNRFDLKEIDPFTFFCFIYKHGTQKRLLLLQEIAKEFNVTVPSDEEGVPSVNAQKVCLFPYETTRINNEINRLWDFFESALKNTISDEQFQDILTITGTGKTKLTEGLFNILPDKYLPINGPTKTYIKEVLAIAPVFNTYTEYLSLLEKIKSKIVIPFYELSYEAWKWNDEQSNVNYWVFQGNPKVFDFETALKQEILKDWTVSAHKEKIKVGDKIILWITGNKAGCYALAEVSSDPHEKKSAPDDYLWKDEDKSNFKAGITITHNWVNAPILKTTIDEIDNLTELKVGNQGTNFSATKEQYETIMELAENQNSKKYWIYAPGENASKWDEFYDLGLMAIGWDKIGDLRKLNSKEKISGALNKTYGGNENKMNQVLAIYDFVNSINIGDVVIVKKGSKELLGYGIVTSDYYYDINRKDYCSCRKVEWKLKGNWKIDFTLVLKTLTDITRYTSGNPKYKTYYEELMGIMTEENPSDNRVRFTTWLITKYGENTGTSSSYIKAIDILSQILSKELFKTSDDNFLGSLYQDLIKEQRNQEGRYYHPDAPSYGSNGFYSASIKSYREFLQEKITINEFKSNYMSIPLNTILYGPPGTGKTYLLKNKYMKEFTSTENSITQEEFLIDIIQHCSWWQVIALALRQMGKTKVSDIKNHQYVKIKTNLSNSTSINQTIWGQLQSHTIEECKEVNVQRRMTPLIFNKSSDSNWEILENQLLDQAPELLELENKINDFSKIPNKKIERFEFVTFHQSYSYEDFVEGIKPELNNTDIAYKIEEGIFQKMCNRARNDKANNYAIFIDEINRGNISSIFGELITLIEDDKREGQPNEISATLPYSQKLFSVPSNLYIIGTMNTADRSVEALDTALRRRFSFIELNPDPQQLSSANYACTGINLSKLLTAINARVEKLLDKDYCIGHSYFMGIKDKANPLSEIRIIFQNKILPLLQEYFYGDWGKIMLVLGDGFVEKKTSNISFLSTNKYDNYEDFEEKPIYKFTNAESWTLKTFGAIYE